MALEGDSSSLREYDRSYLGKLQNNSAMSVLQTGGEEFERCENLIEDGLIGSGVFWSLTHARNIMPSHYISACAAFIFHHSHFNLFLT